MRFLTFIISFFGAFLSGVAWSDMTHFKTLFYRVEHAGIKKKYRIVLLSDLHEKTYGKRNSRLIKAVEKVKPDCIIMAGDMISAGKEPDLNPVAQLIIALAPKYPVYYVMGNHELKILKYPKRYKTNYEAFKHAIKSCGAKILDDSGIYLTEENIKISGLTMDMSFYNKRGRSYMDKSYVKMHLGNKDKNVYQILVGHNPEYFNAYSGWGADMTLAGHYHGGFMRVPFLGGLISPKYKLFPPYSGGIFWENDSCMIVSRGLGMHTLPLRFFNPGELVVVDLQHED